MDRSVIRVTLINALGERCDVELQPGDILEFRSFTDRHFYRAELLGKAPKGYMLRVRLESGVERSCQPLVRRYWRDGVVYE